MTTTKKIFGLRCKGRQYKQKQTKKRLRASQTELTLRLSLAICKPEHAAWSLDEVPLLTCGCVTAVYFWRLIYKNVFYQKLNSLKGIADLKNECKFTQPYVVPGYYELLSSMKQKIIFHVLSQTSFINQIKWFYKHSSSLSLVFQVLKNWRWVNVDRIYYRLNTEKINKGQVTSTPLFPSVLSFTLKGQL